jgi:hypothetical protein
MADSANAYSSVEIFLDEVRSKMSGNFDYTPKDANDKWVFAEVAVGSGASADLLDTGDSFFGASGQIATDNVIHWIAIKNLSTTATEGVAIDLITGTAAYNLKGINVIGAGEIIILKPANTTVADLHARSCTLDGSYGYPSAQGSATVNVHVAAIIDDV